MKNKPPRITKPKPTIDMLRKRYTYDPVKGTVTSHVHKKIVYGGGLDTPTVVGVDGHVFSVAKLAYWLHCGIEPAPRIPVVLLNRKTTDLRWVNLHQLTPAEYRAAGQRRASIARTLRPSKDGYLYSKETPLPWPTYTRTAAEQALDPEVMSQEPETTLW